jgi:WD40 repeat protein/serine/threonine protein kinase
MHPDAVSLFHRLADRSAPEREAFYARERVPAAVRAEVESLLQFDQASVGAIHARVAEAAEAAVGDWTEPEGSAVDQSPWGEAPPADRPGNRHGPYRLIELIGEGGMGSVWLAEQDQPLRRTVALKVIKPGRVSREVLARFESERQSLARLNHQHIATVLDAGVMTDGRPYFVMEYVAGQPITVFADEHALGLRERLHLFGQVCDGVEYAHQKAILHRDLKPSNILVSKQGSELVAKIIDFGVAKAMGTEHDGRTQHTALGMVIGTPQYMSPEQAGLSDGGVDTRSDVYSLGLVLYELLAGAPPFDPGELRRKPLFDALKMVREADVPRLTTRLRQSPSSIANEIADRRRTTRRSLLRRLRGDLEWIVARATAKAPADRYASVSEFRSDIDRYLRGEPVLAGPPSTWYRVAKLAGRHRAAATAFVLILTAITVSAIVSSIALVRARAAEALKGRQLVASMVARGMARVDAGDPLTGLIYLTRSLELEADPQRVRGHRTRIGEVLQRSPRLVRVWHHSSGIVAMDVAATRGLVVTGSTDGVLMVRSFPAGDPLAEIREASPITSVALSSNGHVLVAGYADGTLRVFDPDNGTRLWEFHQSEAITDIAVSADGQLAAVAAGRSIKVWNVTDGQPSFESVHRGPTRRVEFSGAGDVVGSAGVDGLRLWHSRTGAPIGSLMAHDGTMGVHDLAFSDDGRWIATAGNDATARLWDVQSTRQVGNSMPHDGYGHVTGVRFAADSRLLLTTSIEGATRVWNLPETVLAGRPLPSASIVNAPEVSPDLIVAAPTQGGAVDLWPIASMGSTRQAPRPLASLPHGAMASVRFDATGRFLITAGADGLVRVWDIAPALPAPPALAVEEGDFHWRAVPSADATRLAVSSGGSAARAACRVFDPATGAPVTPTMRLEGLNTGLALSGDARIVATASGSGSIRLWDARNGEPLTPMIADGDEWSIAVVSPDGTLFAVASDPDSSNTVRVRRTTDGSSVTDVPPQAGPVRFIDFSADSQRLLIASDAVTSNITVWDIPGNRPLWVETHRDGATSAAWSPDGRSVFSGGGDQQVQIWNAASGGPGPVLLKMLGHPSTLNVSSDGRRLLVGTSGGNVALADLASNQLLALMSQHGFVYEARFSPDGSLALTSGSDSTARLWDGQTGEPLTPALQAHGLSRSARFLPDGRAWAWTGQGVYIDTLTVEARGLDQLRSMVESSAARTLSDSGAELPLSPEQVEARFSTVADSRRVVAEPSPDYHVRRAYDAWRSRKFEIVASDLEAARVHRALRWPDVMRLVGAYAALSRWDDALRELRMQQSQWHAAPELLYMEAIALSHAGEPDALTAHCRRALDATRDTAHPERAYWAARACLVSQTIADQDRHALEQRIDLAYPTVAGNFGRDELNAALKWRTGRVAEAFSFFSSKPTGERASRLSLLLRAAIALADGRPSEGSDGLRRADAGVLPAASSHLRPWLDAEAKMLRDQLVQGLRIRSGQRATARTGR